VQCVVHPIEVVEQTGHRRDLDDFPFIVMRAQPREQTLADQMRIECQLLRVRQRCFLSFAERTILKIEKALQLFLGRTVPRSLRGMRAISILAPVDP
jgi:hypothetical protein